MPDLVPVETTVRRMRTGDVTDAGSVVQRIDAKEKWATVFYADGEKQRVEADLQVTVKRLQLTPDEVAAEAQATGYRQMRETLEDVTEDPAAGILEQLKKPMKDAWTRLRWHDVDGFIKQQALWMHLQRVESILEKFAERHGDGADPDQLLLDAWAQWHLNQQEDVKRGRDPFNRSTAVMSNLYEDAERWAADVLMGSWQFAEAARMIRDRVVEFQRRDR